LAVKLPQNMKNNRFEIQIETQDKLEFSICQDYWHFNKSEKYTYYVREIATKYGISIINVTEIAIQNSKFISKCINCTKILNQYLKRSDFIIDEIFMNSFSICQECKSELEKLKIARNESTKQQILDSKKDKPFDIEKKFEKMENSFQERIWKVLNEMELETLIQIAECESKSEIYDTIFYNNKDIGGSYRYKIWSRVNKLEELNLIWVERNIDNKISEFHILDKLKNQLKLNYPELFIDDTVPKTV